ncbi:MAG: hypothetical protein HC913_02710 [Microscillaceae bacterium]|nr:hypothetical protein [Microscillaceae bacterium]
MRRVVRFFKNVTILVFLLALSLSYYELSDMTTPVLIYKSTGNIGAFSIDNHTYFYVPSIFLVLVNVLLALLVRVLRGVPLARLPIPQKAFWLSTPALRQQLREVLMTWIYSLAIIINVFLTVMLVKVWMVNRNQGGEAFEYLWFLLIFLVFFTAWLGFIIYRLRLTREEFIT